MFNKVTIIGLGLIGGSLGKGLIAKKLADEVVGIDVSSKSLLLAKRQKAITKISKDELDDLASSDLVVFATPVLAIKEQIKDFADFISSNALVIDVGSTKKSILKEAYKWFKNNNFVGCHPMAGSEKSGVGASVSDLFKNKPCLVLCDKNSKALFVNKAKKLWRLLGAKVVCVDSYKHDDWLAACSHLPHVLSFSCMRSVEKVIGINQLKKIAGPSFKSYTRVAGSDPKMWTDIFIDNKTNILKQIKKYKQELSHIENMIENEDNKKILNYINQTAKQWRKI